MTRVVRRSVVAVIALAVLAVPGCSGGHTKRPVASSTSTTAVPVIAMTITRADGVPDAVKTAVQATLDVWLRDGLANPLRTGQPAPAMSGAFAPAALAQVDGADHASLVEDGTPPGGLVVQNQADAVLTPFTGPDGQISLVDATVTISLRVSQPSGTVVVVRTGDLVLVSGTPWLIDSYDVVAKHDSAPPPLTTTTNKKTKTTRKVSR